MARQRIRAKANIGEGIEDFYMDQVDTDLIPVTKILLGDDDVDGGFVTGSNPLPVAGSVSINDPSTTVAFGPISTPSTALFTAVDTAGEISIQLQLTGRFDKGGVYFEASHDGLEFHPVLATTREDETLVEIVYAPDMVTLPVTGKYFRAVTTTDFAGSISGLYSLRRAIAPTPFTQTKLVDMEAGLLFPVAGKDPKGNYARMKVAEDGGVMPADGTVVQGFRNGTQVGPIVTVDTAGYNSVAMQLAGTFTGTVTFQVSNDGSVWLPVQAWPVAGGAAPVTSATAVGQWVIPAAGRFIRAALTTAGSGFPLAIAVLKNAAAFFPASTPTVSAAISGTPGMNISQVGGTATAAGGLPLIASGATNGATPFTLIAAGTNNLTQLKATIGRIITLHIRNRVASERFLKLFALPSASVTMGTTNATHSFPIPASGELNLPIPATGWNMGGTGISFALTTGLALNDNSAVTANDLVVNGTYI